MKTLAISRLIGSEASAIAKHVADTLEYDLVDKGVLQGTMEQYGLTRFGDFYNSQPNIWDLANSKNLQVISMLNDTMKALANRGKTVILARGAYAALGDNTNVFKIRIQSPTDSRANRIMAREGISDRKSVEKQIAMDDKSRRKFVKLFYNKKYFNAADFDLVINTGIVSIKSAENWIIEAARMFESKDSGPNVQTTSQYKVDPLLSEAIEYALQRRV